MSPIELAAILIVTEQQKRMFAGSPETPDISRTTCRKKKRFAILSKWLGAAFIWTGEKLLRYADQTVVISPKV